MQTIYLGDRALAYQMALVPSASASAALSRVSLRCTLRRDPEAAAVHFYRWATGYCGGGNQFDAVRCLPRELEEDRVGHARATLRELLQVAVPSPARSSLRQLAVRRVGEPAAQTPLMTRRTDSQSC